MVDPYRCIYHDRVRNVPSDAKLFSLLAPRLRRLPISAEAVVIQIGYAFFSGKYVNRGRLDAWLSRHLQTGCPSDTTIMSDLLLVHHFLQRGCFRLDLIAVGNSAIDAQSA